MTEKLLKPEWREYLMGFARHAATKSKDSTQVGAVLVGSDGEVLLTGFNGIPRGVVDLPERRERPIKYKWVVHAERNLLDLAARRGIRTEGCTVFVTHACCSSCMGSLIQAGITRVVIGDGETSMPSQDFAIARIMAIEAEIEYLNMRMDLA